MAVSWAACIPLIFFLNDSEIMLMSFPELSKPRESRCIGKDKPVFFLLNFRLVGYPECSGLDAKLVRNGQEPVTGSGVWILHCQPQGASLFLPLRCVVPPSSALVLCYVLFTHIPAYSVGESLADPFFLIFRFEGRKCLCLWNVLHGERSEGSFSMMAPVRPKWSHPGRWQRWDTWGHRLSPASPGVSRL